MKYIVAAAALVATVSAQCVDTVPYKFQLSPVNVSQSEGTAKRDTLEKRQAVCSKTPIITLQGGILIDQMGSQGEVVVNNQFQFDPVDQLQPAIYQSGFCINDNNTLSVGGSAIFYSCISGDFSNLYNADIGSECSQVYLDTVECSGGIASGSTSLSSATGTGSATSASSSGVATTPATTMSTTAAPNTQSAAPAPYPVGNSTTPAGTASAAPSGSATTTDGASSTSSIAFQPSNGANVLAMGSQLLAGVAAVGAYALL